MLECVREAIWCPFVAVIVILLDWITFNVVCKENKGEWHKNIYADK